MDEAICVADGGLYAQKWMRHVGKDGAIRLVDGPHFRLDRLDGPPPKEIAADYGGAPLLAIPVDGAVTVNGEQIAPGGCALVEDVGALELSPGTRALIAQPV